VELNLPICDPDVDVFLEARRLLYFKGSRDRDAKVADDVLGKEPPPPVNGRAEGNGGGVEEVPERHKTCFALSLAARVVMTCARRTLVCARSRRSAACCRQRGD